MTVSGAPRENCRYSIGVIWILVASHCAMNTVKEDEANSKAGEDEANSKAG